MNRHAHETPRSRVGRTYGLLVLTLVGCGQAQGSRPEPQVDRAAATVYQVSDTTITSTFDASGVAEPVQRATLSTRLMGNVVSVAVHEGDRVNPGDILLRLDAREIDSRRSQAQAGQQAAEAVYRDAVTQTERFRRLYQDSAATRYQLDQAETSLTRAEAGFKTATGALSELDALGSYSEVRAPFAGVITRRLVDPGGFAGPGAPLLEIQDPSRLRVSVSAPPTIASSLARGATIEVLIEGRFATGRVEGVVPSTTGSVYRLNVLIDNRVGQFLVGGAAVVSIPNGRRKAILIPAGAVIREGDLTGVRVVTDGRSELRWVRVGRTFPASGPAAGSLLEIVSGLIAGDALTIGET